MTGPSIPAFLDEPPRSQRLTPYDRTHMVLYLRLLDAARALGLPLDVAELAEPAIRELYAARRVLVRPDGHVAWRGPAVPADAAALLDTVRGH